MKFSFPFSIPVLSLLIVAGLGDVGVSQVRPHPGSEVEVVSTDSFGFCDTAGADQFADVVSADRTAEAILCLRALGVVLGRGDDTYGPDLSLTREQMASFLVRVWRDVLGNDCPGEGGVAAFGDVPSDSVHAADIGCLYRLGLTQGRSSTEFGYSDDLRHSEIRLFLFRLYELAGLRCEGDNGSESVRALECMSKVGVISTEQQSLSSASVSRAEMAVYVVSLLAVLLEGVETKEMHVPVFMCQPSGGSYTDETLDVLVRALNRQLSAFYAWQSSGRFLVKFTKGSVIDISSDAMTSSTAATFPKECDPGLEIDRLYMFFPSDPLTQRAAGRAQLGGRLGVTYLHPSNVPKINEWWNSSEISKRDRTSHSYSSVLYPVKVTAHETDHLLLGIEHIGEAHGATGYGTRWHGPFGNLTDFSALTRDHLSFSYFDPSEHIIKYQVQTTTSHHGLVPPFAKDGHIEGDFALWPGDILFGGLLTCRDRERLGWPVGDNYPACARIPPFPPTVQTDRNDGGEVTIDVYPGESESPILGYIMEIQEEREIDLAHPDLAPFRSLIDSIALPQSDALKILLDVMRDGIEADRKGVLPDDPVFDDVVDEHRLSLLPGPHGTTMCEVIECAEFEGADFSTITRYRDFFSYDESTGKYTLTIFTKHLLQPDDFPVALPEPGKRYRVGVRAFSKYGEGSPVWENIVR